MDISLTIIEVFILIFLALVNDIKTYKIRNTLILTFIIMGITTNYILHGKTGLIGSLLGILVPVIILFCLFVIRMLGAGDIKLFSAIGAIMGVNFIIYVIIYSFLWGGVISLLLILVRGNAMKRLNYLYNYIESCILTHSILPYIDFTEKDDGSNFRFSYAITLGTISGFINIFRRF